MLVEEPAETAVEQAALERKVLRFYRELAALPDSDRRAHLALQRQAHATYIGRGLARLPGGFISLDASRPWLVYWMTHSLALLQAPLPPEVSAEDIIAFLRQCRAPSGGFGGGPGQQPHLAPTYAAVATLVTLGGPGAMQAIDRPAMLSFLRRMCVPAIRGGGFYLCQDGEVDVRGCYTAMATAHMLGLDAAALAQEASMVEYVLSCQTYEGGIGGEPGNEAHGGYTFCGAAALAIAGAAGALDIPALTRWATSCQGTVEGGFMGRTNKLVDGCYSYWVGGLFPLLASLSAPQPPNGANSQLPAGAGPHPARPPAEQHRQQEPGTGPPPLSATEGKPSFGGRRRITVQPLPHLSGRSLLQHSTATADALAALAEEASAAKPAGGGVSDEAAVYAEGYAAAVQCSATVLAARWAAGSTPSGSSAAQAGGRNGAASGGRAASDGGAASRPEAGGDGATGGGTAKRADTAAGNGISSRSPAAAQRAVAAPLYDVEAMQLWLLQCCQVIKGGLRDKPGKPVDYYHSCYCLSGLSAAQHYGGIVVGPPENLLAAADALCNVMALRLEAARRFFGTADT